jgi:hypothetical protein
METREGADDRRRPDSAKLPAKVAAGEHWPLAPKHVDAGYS